MTFLLMTLVYNPCFQKRWLTYSLFFFLFLAALITQSRSPILFLAVVFLIYRQYVFYQRKDRLPYFILRILILAFVFLIGALLAEIFFDQINSFDNSRFLFYIKGLVHMMDEPWGNSLLLTDTTMPLLNYHNTFLSMGNRIAAILFIFMIAYMIYVLYLAYKIKNPDIKYSAYFLLYFCFHNFMIEDVVKFDYFSLILFFALYPIIDNARKEFNDQKL